MFRRYLMKHQRGIAIVRAWPSTIQRPVSTRENNFQQALLRRWRIAERSWPQPHRSISTTSTIPGDVYCSLRDHGGAAKTATITIRNPSKLNIVDSVLLAKLRKACDSLQSNLDLRVVILTGGPTAPGKPPAFIGGADIKEMIQISTTNQAREFITGVHDLCTALRDLPVPVIAKVHGLCLGGGLEIAAACDLRACTEMSTFGMPEVNVGIPSVVEAALLPSLIGMGRTRRLCYLAENISATEAHRWGLVEQVVKDKSSLDYLVDDWSRRIAGMAPRAIRSQKALALAWERSTIDEGIKIGIDYFADSFKDGGQEPKEFMGKFVNRKRT